MKKLWLVLPLIWTLGFMSSCEPPISSSVEDSQSSNVDSSSSQSSSSTSVIKGRDLYCSPNGGGTDAKGTKDDPYNVLYAMSQLQPGHKIILLEGTYKYSFTLQTTLESEVTPATSEEGRKLMEPEKDENGNYKKVTFDFSDMVFASSNRGISLDSDYWHIRGFEVVGAGDNGIYIGGHHNIVENIDVHDCQDTGIQLGRRASNLNEIEDWPSYNLILNCTSHDNHDPTGEDSDGFACKLTTGIGNVFDGCIAYNNVDDGWDLYTKGESGPIGPVTIKNCVAFNNGITRGGVGTANSDGNGFKLGGESISVPHTVINCVAFNNMATGFTDNSNPGTIYLENCTAFNNGTRDDDGYNFSTCRDTATSINFYKNCLSFCTGDRVSPITGEVRISNSKDEYKGSASHCLFYNSLSSFYTEDLTEVDYSKESLRGVLKDISNPFVSVDPIQKQSMKDQPLSSEDMMDVHALLRDKEGNVNLGDFLKVREDSPVYTMGENSSPLGANLSK